MQGGETYRISGGETEKPTSPTLEYSSKVQSGVAPYSPAAKSKPLFATAWYPGKHAAGVCSTAESYCVPDKVLL